MAEPEPDSKPGERTSIISHLEELRSEAEECIGQLAFRTDENLNVEVETPSNLPSIGAPQSGHGGRPETARVAACTTMHWFISYFAHTRGPQDWTVDGAVIQAYNVPLMALPPMGERWHSNHHAFPASARHGLYPGQIDLGYRFIQLLELLRSKAVDLWVRKRRQTGQRKTYLSVNELNFPDDFLLLPLFLLLLFFKEKHSRLITVELF